MSSIKKGAINAAVKAVWVSNVMDELGLPHKNLSMVCCDMVIFPSKTISEQPIRIPNLIFVAISNDEPL